MRMMSMTILKMRSEPVWVLAMPYGSEEPAASMATHTPLGSALDALTPFE
jgi:hypothetical protein